MEQALTELAILLMEQGQKNAKPFDGFVVGKVLAPPPGIQVSIDEAIILDKTHLIIAAHVLSDYEREFEISDANMQFVDENCGTTNVASNHMHSIQSINVDAQNAKLKGKLKWIDTLQQGDLVILVPAANQQMYILIDKAVEL